MAVGRLGLSSGQYYRLTFRELQYKIDADIEKSQDMWDYTRHIMAAMGAGDGKPARCIPLDRDEKIEEARRLKKLKKVEDAKIFLDRMKKIKL